MSALSLEQSMTVCTEALAEGKRLGCKPLAVAVLDAGGHLKTFLRQDGASLMRFGVARGKAWGALGMGMGSRALAAVAAERPAFVDSLVAISGGRLVPVPGGVLIRDAEGAILGAVGISGDTSDRDEACAVAGIRAAGLSAETGGT